MAKYSLRKTRKVRKTGGAGQANSPVALLLKALPDEHDYERMVDYDSSSINTTKSYEEFVNYQRATATGLSADDSAFLKNLVQRVLRGKMSQVDMESCGPMRSSYVYFDKKQNLVVGSPR